MKRKPETYSYLDAIMASSTEPLPQFKRDFQLLRMHSGLAAIESGAEPTKDDWRVISDAANLLESLIELGHVQDPDDLLGDAITALAHAGKRHIEGKPIRFDGAGIQTVRSLLASYSECLNTLSARIMIVAHRHCEKRIRAILAGKSRAGDVEIVDL